MTHIHPKLQLPVKETRFTNAQQFLEKYHGIIKLE